MRILWKLVTICTGVALAACAADPITPAPDGEDCEAAGDEDGNGLSDCDDPICAAASMCQPACGNGRLEAEEGCDDGNATDGDGCDSNCTITACGNGVAVAGEACDDGNLTDGDGCDSNCTVTACGNGVVTSSEACDDGNATNWDGCNRSCGGNVPVYLKASNTGVNDHFGSHAPLSIETSSSIAISGDGSTLVVGACGEDSVAPGIGGNQADNSALEAGAVYVFTRNGLVWSQQAYIKASNPGSGDQFGCGLALSADGSTLAVGAISEDSAATGIDGNQVDESVLGAGAVYVFTRSGTTWSQQAYVKASNTGLGDLFGWSVALSADGSTLAVGALGEDSAATGVGGDQSDNSLSEAGAIYVFTRSGTTWSQQAYVKASSMGSERYFGESVALSADGSTLAVGRAGRDPFSADAGVVHVFTRSGAAWSQQAYLKGANTNNGSYDRFGIRVALSADGSTLVVGAMLEDSAATGIDGNGDDNSATNAGAVYVFTRSNMAWTQQAYIKASNTRAADYFGLDVALSADGSTLAVGAVAEDSAATGIGGDQASNAGYDSGAVYVFTRSGTVWSQRAYVKASNTGVSDLFGGSVALSADGSTLAVGAGGEDSAATGTGGNQADNSSENTGAVYVFQ